MPIAWTIRDSTSATSRGDSPRAICSSPWRRINGWPPSSCTPVSNETRVRVEGLSNTSATLLPSSAREARRSALSSIARSRSRRCSAVVSSSPVRKCFANASPQLESLPRPRLPARPGSLHAALAPAARDRAKRDARAGEPVAVPRVLGLARRARVGRRAAPGGAAALVPRLRPADGRERRPGVHLAQRRAAAPAPPGLGEPGPDRLLGGRLEPAARAPAGARARAAAA